MVWAGSVVAWVFIDGCSDILHIGRHERRRTFSFCDKAVRPRKKILMRMRDSGRERSEAVGGGIVLFADACLQVLCIQPLSHYLCKLLILVRNRLNRSGQATEK